MSYTNRSTNMRTFTRLVVAATAIQAATVMAGKGKKERKRANAGSVFSGMMKAAGMGAAVGSMPMAAGFEIHPLYRSTHSELSALLTKPCTVDACPMESKFKYWATTQSKPYVTKRVFEKETGGTTVQILPTPGMEDEYAARYGAFAENVKKAHGYNVKSQGRSVHGITKFMDMPEEEFMKQRGGMIVDAATHEEFKQMPKVKKSASEFLRGAGASGSKDWVQEGMTTAVKDQGQCGSCWAFSTTEQVESMAIKAGITDPDGDNYVLGPQELVSCDHNGDMGCNGGLPLNALKWLEKRGLEQESDYPYMSGFTGQSGTCSMTKSDQVIEVSSFKRVSSGADSESDLVDYLLNEGPVSVGVDANGAWQTYQGGVMTPDLCEGQLDHAVQAVGVDTESFEPYIKVRNSWGPDWGEDGFIRLAQGSNTCGVANMGVTADVKDMSTNILIKK